MQLKRLEKAEPPAQTVLDGLSRGDPTALGVDSLRETHQRAELAVTILIFHDFPHAWAPDQVTMISRHLHSRPRKTFENKLIKLIIHSVSMADMISIIILTRTRKDVGQSMSYMTPFISYLQLIKEKETTGVPAVPKRRG